MTDTFDYPDAPPLSDTDARIPGVPSPDATAIAMALNRIAKAIEGLSVSPGGAPPPTGAPSAPPGGQSNGDDTQIRRGKKIYAICASQSGGKPTGEWEIGAIGQRVTGHPVNPNSQKWSEADQVAVLDAFKQWGIG